MTLNRRTATGFFLVSLLLPAIGQSAPWEIYLEKGFKKVETVLEVHPSSPEFLNAKILVSASAEPVLIDKITEIKFNPPKTESLIQTRRLEQRIQELEAEIMKLRKEIEVYKAPPNQIAGPLTEATPSQNRLKKKDFEDVRKYDFVKVWNLFIIKTSDMTSEALENLFESDFKDKEVQWTGRVIDVDSYFFSTAAFVRCGKGEMEGTADTVVEKDTNCNFDLESLSTAPRK